MVNAKSAAAADCAPRRSSLAGRSTSQAERKQVGCINPGFNPGLMHPTCLLKLVLKDLIPEYRT